MLPALIADPTLPALFVAGLAGGVHCAGMCGGIVTALARSTSASQARPFTVPVTPGSLQPAASGATRIIAIVPVAPIATTARPLPPLRKDSAACGATACNAGRRDAHLLAFNIGRIGSYVIAGAIAGTVGSLGWIVANLLPIQRTGFVLTNVALLLLGLSLAGGSAGRLIDRLVARLSGGGWQALRRVALRPFGDHAASRAFATGLAWGWVPCAMVYTALLSALASGDPARGALMMACFGLGTLPNLMGLQWLASSALRTSTWRWLRPLSAWLLVAFALAGLARIDPLTPLFSLANRCLTLLR